LRRFLRAYAKGETDYVESHPANRSWLERHPKVDPRTWSKGLERHGHDEQIGDFILAQEQDPFEILRMGSHVGTCVGLGGAFAYSAVAVLLDVNKQVVYARDSRGLPLARQLIAIDSGQKLVPFRVYPTVGSSLERAFLDYDRALAEALGLEIDTVGEDIVHVVSQDWWHDSGWKTSAPEDEAPEVPPASK